MTLLLRIAMGDAVFINQKVVGVHVSSSDRKSPIDWGPASLRSTLRLTLVILLVVTSLFVVHVHAGRTEASVDSSTVLSISSAEGCALTRLRKAYKYK